MRGFITLLALLSFWAGAASAAPRDDRIIAETWRSTLFEQDAPTGLERADVDDSRWATVRVPHNWQGYAYDRQVVKGARHGTAWYRTHLTLADVKEVLRDIAQESETPPQNDASPLDSAPGKLNSRPAPLDGAPSVPGALDITRLKLSTAEVDGLSSEIAALSADHHTDRLQRLERSMMRLERINLQTLALLQKLVDAVKQH